MTNMKIVLIGTESLLLATCVGLDHEKVSSTTIYLLICRTIQVGLREYTAYNSDEKVINVCLKGYQSQASQPYKLVVSAAPTPKMSTTATSLPVHP
jgi:hypothetical protein